MSDERIPQEPPSTYDAAPAAPEPTGPPWRWRDIVKAALLIVVGSFGIGVVVAIADVITGTTPDRNASLSALPLFVIGVGIYAWVVLAVYLFAVRRAHGSWAAVGLRSFEWWWVPLAPVLLMIELAGMVFINMQLVTRLTGAPFQNPQVEALTGGARLNLQDLLLLLLLVAIVAPFAEELFFRGMIYPVMRRQWGVPLAIFANALLFALIHFIPVLIPALFLIGLILAWARERSQSILPGMLLHFLQNSIVVIGIYVATSGGG